MMHSLSPTTRRLVGLLFLLAGVLIAVAELLRLGTWLAAGLAFESMIAFHALLLAGGVLLARYGWRVRRDGHVSDEPGDGAIT